jgi:Holliday junction resolvasome RuvABC endonuclease subunit
LAILEKPGYWMNRSGSSRQSIEKMAMARGAMLLACADASVPSLEVDFQTVRRVLLGRGNAPASAVPEFVSGLGIPLPRRKGNEIDLDVANAILMALFGLATRAGRD